MSVFFIRVWSDNFDGALFTEDGYQELRLQMSSGDFAVHTIRTVYAKRLTEIEPIYAVSTNGEVYELRSTGEYINEVIQLSDWKAKPRVKVKPECPWLVRTGTVLKFPAKRKRNKRKVA